MNKVFLIGRLTKDPVFKVVNDKKVGTFTIAVDRNYKDENGNRPADFIPVTVWGGGAEVVEKYCQKGKQIALIGEIRTRSYEDKDKKRRYVTEVLAREIELLADAKKGQTKGEENDEEEFNFEGMEDNLFEE
jgi:single-strand DNA-binding protein